MIRFQAACFCLMEEAAIPVAFDVFHQFIYRIEPYIAAILYSNIYSVVVCQERREFGEAYRDGELDRT